MRPLLTVAIPTYNGGKNLLRAVKSCKYINLENEQFEILVVDNCSTDGSIEEVKKLQQYFPNMRIVINEKNYGRIGNWNRCIDLAKGKYLIFLFSNDELYEKYDFKKHIELLESNKELAIIFNKVKYRYKNIETITTNFFTEKIVSLDVFVKKYFYNKKKFTSFGILQQHIYRLDTIKNNLLCFNNNLDRTTDRIFIFETIFNHTNQQIYFSHEIQSIWNFSHNRYHSKAHFEIKDDDIVTIFKRSWLQELEANAYILSKMKFNMKNIIKIHYEKFYLIFVLNNLKKFLNYQYEKTPDNLTLEIFVKFLKGMCKTLNINCLKIEVLVTFKILNKILNKLFTRKQNV